MSFKPSNSGSISADRLVSIDATSISVLWISPIGTGVGRADARFHTEEDYIIISCRGVRETVSFGGAALWMACRTAGRQNHLPRSGLWAACPSSRAREVSATVEFETERQLRASPQACGLWYNTNHYGNEDSCIQGRDCRNARSRCQFVVFKEGNLPS